MSTISSAARTVARNAINTLVDAGSGTNPTLRYRTAADADLLVINLNATKAIADAVDGVSAINPPAGEASWVGYSQYPTAAGTAAKVVLCDKDGTIVETGSLGVTGDTSAEFHLGSLTMDTGVAANWSAAPTVSQRASYTPS